MLKTSFSRPVLVAALLLATFVHRDGRVLLPSLISMRSNEPAKETANSKTELRLLETVPKQITMSASLATDNITRSAEAEIRTLFAAAQFAEAIRLAQKQLDRQDLNGVYKSWLTQQIPVLKLGLAWQWIRAGHCDDAITNLESLLKTQEAPLALKGLGFCYIKAKDMFSARPHLQQYLAAKPQDPEAYLLLAEVEESLGSLETAVELTNKAQALPHLTDDEREDLIKREQKMSARLAETPGQADLISGFFWVKYHSGEQSAIVQQVLEILQNHVHFLVQNLGFEYPNQSIEVVLHRRETFQKTTHSPSWAAAVYDGSIRVPVTPEQKIDEAFERVLRHELTHAMLSEQARKQTLPSWFQEGVAQLTECQTLCKNYRFAATSQKFLSSHFFDKNFASLPSREASIVYNQSYYLILTLTNSSQFYGLSGLKQIIQTMPTLNVFDSYTLLQQIGITFETLHSTANALWENQQSF